MRTPEYVCLGAFTSCPHRFQWWCSQQVSDQIQLQVQNTEISKVNFISWKKLRSTVNDVLFILKTKYSQLNISIAYQDTTQSYPEPGQLLLYTNILHFSQNINMNNSIEDEKKTQNYSTKALYKKIQHMGKISRTSKQTVSIYLYPSSTRGKKRNGAGCKEHKNYLKKN